MEAVDVVGRAEPGVLPCPARRPDSRVTVDPVAVGRLRPADPADLAEVRAAAADADAARRQVAANLLGEAPAQVAAADWARLIADPVRTVRRAAVDAMVDSGRSGLRSLLETPGRAGGRAEPRRHRCLRR